VTGWGKEQDEQRWQGSSQMRDCVEETDSSPQPDIPGRV
jgi:hypothetical protein